MRFSEAEIQAAHRLKALGLEWTPTVGNYVFDANDSVEPDSPFQDGVYFILNYDHFMRLLGGVENFKERMVWLLTWEDLRHQLRERGIDDATVFAAVFETVSQTREGKTAFDNGDERLALYELLIDQLAPIQA